MDNTIILAICQHLQENGYSKAVKFFSHPIIEIRKPYIASIFITHKENNTIKVEAPSRIIILELEDPNFYQELLRTLKSFRSMEFLEQAITQLLKDHNIAHEKAIQWPHHPIIRIPHGNHTKTHIQLKETIAEIAHYDNRQNSKEVKIVDLKEPNSLDKLLNQIKWYQGYAPTNRS